MSAFAQTTPARCVAFIQKAPALFQLLLIVSIAIMMMLGCERQVILLAKLNMAYVGILYFFETVQQERKVFSAPSVAILTIAFITANYLCFDTYKALYINFAAVTAYTLTLALQRNKDTVVLGSMIAFPVAISALHITSVSCLCISEYLWNVWYCGFIVLNIWMLTKQHLDLLKKLLPTIVLILLFVFTFLLVQMPPKIMHAINPFHIYGYTIDYAYSINTFDIAIYASLGLIISCYYIFRTSRILKIALIIISLILVQFILVSSWRPVWLGLIAGSIFSLFLIQKSKRLLLISAMLLLQIILFTANIANYGDRLNELVSNIGNEERTIIWKDAWTMQTASTASNWLHGHGQNTFALGFKPFSTYSNVNNINFTSPHNIVLDVLYSSGILGMLVVIALCYFPYKYCMKIIYDNEENQSLACITLIATTTLLISAGLNYAFFRLITIFPLAFIYGVLIYLYQNKIQTHKNNANYEIKN